MDAYAATRFKEAVRVLGRLREKGFEAYFAGGYYRDRFLGREPNDVDVATNARPDQVRPLFSRTIPVGEQFGIVIVQLGDERVEVATFREDEGYEDGRRPTGIRFTTAREDAQRRDFTINGVFWDPVDETVHDFIEGRQDLVAGLVRAIGDPDARFDEDKLRILRAPRFAARLGFRVEARTFEAARRRAAEVAVVSQERVRDELEKILLDPTRSRGLELVLGLDLGPIVLPGFERDALARSLRVLAALPARKLPRTLVWGALLAGAMSPASSDSPPPAPSVEAALDALLLRLRLSNADRLGALALAREEHLVRAIGALRLAEQKRLLLREDAPLLLELARAVALATTGDLEGVRVARQRREAFRVEVGPSALASAPLLKGNDLRDLGLRPGPRFKELLAHAEEARLEGRARTREELVELLRVERPELLG